jgi:lysophospholipase L1-like esterase
MGASSREHSWAQLLARHARAVHPTDAVWNLARPGFTTYNVMPEALPGERRPRPPNDRRNITRALSVHPYAVILSLPTNDTLSGVPFTQQQENFERIAEEAGRSGTHLYVMSSQPRNFPRPLREELFRFREWLSVRFAPRYIDVWPGLVGPEMRLREDLDVGDGTHVNDAGHLIIASQVVAADVFGRREERAQVR